MAPDYSQHCHNKSLNCLCSRNKCGIKTCSGCHKKMHMIKAAEFWVQAGLAGSHPVQKERELLQVIKRNPYQHALLCIHQAPYQPDRRTQAELLQVQPPSNQSSSMYMKSLLFGSAVHQRLLAASTSCCCMATSTSVCCVIQNALTLQGTCHVPCYLTHHVTQR